MGEKVSSYNCDEGPDIKSNKAGEKYIIPVLTGFLNTWDRRIEDIEEAGLDGRLIRVGQEDLPESVLLSDIGMPTELYLSMNLTGLTEKEQVRQILVIKTGFIGYLTRLHAIKTHKMDS